MVKIIHPLLYKSAHDDGASKQNAGGRMRVYDPVIRYLLFALNAIVMAAAGVMWRDHELVSSNEAAIRAVDSKVTKVEQYTERQHLEDSKRIDEIRSDVKEVRILVQRILTERNK
jgi:hypothetical protein